MSKSNKNVIQPSNSITSKYNLLPNSELTQENKQIITHELQNELSMFSDHFGDNPPKRPQTRKDCIEGGINAVRPCPYVGCSYHLYLDVDKNTGAIETHTLSELNDVETDLYQMTQTCALDVAELEQGVSLEYIGVLINRTRERVRQIESESIVKIRKYLPVIT